MKALVIGGTGLISTGIIKHLHASGADITVFNRAQRPSTLPANVKTIVGDRNDFPAFKKQFAGQTFDVVIDMIAFGKDQAESDVATFAGRCQQFIFCSTVCTYGVKIPGKVLVDETFPQEPISEYGKNKVVCEKTFLVAQEKKSFAVTIIRPSCTYGPSGGLIDNLEGNAVAWDRIVNGQPVLCAGDGLGLWVATHRDDVGKLFAYAALNPKTYGQAYNATRDENFTWRDYYRQAAAALGTTAKLILMPADWIIKHDAKRFGLLREITRYHGAYDAGKAKRDVPEFKCEIGFQQGAGETFADLRRRNAWRSSQNDAVYETMVSKALAAGVEPVVV